MAEIAELGIRVSADGAIRTTQQLNKDLDTLTGTSKRAETGIGSLSSSFLRHAAVTATIGLAMRKLVQETIAAQDAQAQIEAAIRSTGGAAGRTVTQLQDLASELQNVSTFSDDAVQGAQSLLLTFTKIKGAELDDATRAVVDLATRMGGDLKGAALQVGKALQDPATGLTALTRSGVSFTDTQKDVIKSLFDTGKAAQAQQLILAELRNEFGGSAAAARDTLGGALRGLSNAFGDLFEVSRENSGAAIRAVNGLTDAFVKLNDALAKGGAFAAITRELANLIKAAITAKTVFSEWGRQVDLIGAQITGFTRALRGLSNGDLKEYRAGVKDNQDATERYRESVLRVTKALQEGRDAERASRAPQSSYFNVADAIAAQVKAAKQSLGTFASGAEDVRVVKDEFTKLETTLAHVSAGLQRVVADFVETQERARAAIADSITGRAAENRTIQEQIAALHQGREAYEALLVTQRVSAAIADEEVKAKAGYITLSNEQRQTIEDQVRANAALLKTRQELLNLKPADAASTVPRTGVDSHAFVDDTQNALRAVQQMADILDRTGSSFAQALATAAGSVSAIANGVNAAGKLDTKSSTVDRLSAAGGIVGGAVTLITAWSSHERSIADAARAAATALRELRVAAQQSLAQYNVQANGSELDQALYGLEQQYKTIYRALLAAGGKDPANPARTAHSTIPTAKDFDDAKQSYDALVQKAKDAAAAAFAAAEAEKARNLLNFTQTNDVLELRARGLGSEADALQGQYDIQSKYADAVKQFGETAETARFRTLLLADAERLLQEQRAAEAQRVLRSVFSLTNGAQAFTDPRGASESALFETGRQRYEDASTAAEKAAVALYNMAEQADFFAKRMEADTRTTESFVGRILATLDNPRATEDYNRAAQQRQERVNAAGESPFNQGLLAFTQGTENSFVQYQREVQDQTKAITANNTAAIKANNDWLQAYQANAAKEIEAIDAQIKAEGSKFDRLISAAQEQVGYAQQGVQLAQAQLQATQRAFDSVTAYSKGFLLSDAALLSPVDRAAEARRQFDAQRALAEGGDRTAATGLGSIADAFLKASRDVNASGVGYANDTTLVQKVFAGLTGKYGALLAGDTQGVDAAQAALAIAQSQVDYLNILKQTTLDALEFQKNGISKDAQFQADRIGALNTNLTDGLAALIAAATGSTYDSHLSRAQGLDGYATYNGSVPSSFSVSQREDTPTESANAANIRQIASSQADALAEARAQTTALTALVNSQGAVIQRLADKLDGVATAVTESGERVRRTLLEPLSVRVS